MKNILLVITLFISWNAFALEKTWFCSIEKSGGLQYKRGVWNTVTFKDLRMTVSQTDNYLKFSTKHMNFAPTEKHCVSSAPSLVSCSDYSTIFTLNTKTGFATSAKTFGWLSEKGEEGNSYDTLSTSVWRCESF